MGWNEFLSQFEWYQGEHLTLIGPTKSGKTTLARELLRRARAEGTHPWQLIIATKTLDEIIDDFTAEGFVKIPTWTVSDPDVHRKLILHPRLRSLGNEDKAHQRVEIRRALNGAYQQHGWLVLMDEFKHIAAALSLEDEAEMLLHQGRSAGISVVTGVQRPRHVPLMVYDQADHIFMWEARDYNIRKRLGEIGGKVDTDLIEYGLRNLKDRHEFLYISPSLGTVIQTKVEL
jgi:energy-coupling factor transporter ATP-binding protein EcfA2